MISSYHDLLFLYASHIATNKSDLEPFLNPKRCPASLENSLCIVSGIENCKTVFLSDFSRAGACRLLFVSSGAGGIPFPDLG